MRKPGCQHCLCHEVDSCDFQPVEYLLLLVLMRPVRCPHCQAKQYSWVAPLRKLLQFTSAQGQVALPYRR